MKLFVGAGALLSFVIGVLCIVVDIFQPSLIGNGLLVLAGAIFIGSSLIASALVSRK